MKAVTQNLVKCVTHRLSLWHVHCTAHNDHGERKSEAITHGVTQTDEQTAVYSWKRWIHANNCQLQRHVDADDGINSDFEKHEHVQYDGMTKKDETRSTLCYRKTNFWPSKKKKKSPDLHGWDVRFFSKVFLESKVSVHL